MITVHYREHEFGPEKPRLRIWVDGWLPDQFEVVDHNDFQNAKALMERLRVVKFQHHGADED